MGWGYTALHVAIALGNDEIVRRLEECPTSGGFPGTVDDLRWQIDFDGLIDAPVYRSSGSFRDRVGSDMTDQESTLQGETLISLRRTNSNGQLPQRRRRKHSSV
ncbi:hypothetical protein AC1031_014545 [Aphanomyces cochlioides]|nr:hypothetical protein AC1031_014545 [Aphanomyces cochlioides]